MRRNENPSPHRLSDFGVCDEADFFTGSQLDYGTCRHSKLRIFAWKRYVNNPLEVVHMKF